MVLNALITKFDFVAHDGKMAAAIKLDTVGRLSRNRL